MSKKDFVQGIRREYAGDSERSRTNQRNACDRLASELYSTRAHFIFELIQNAEDNDYADGVEPTLRFAVQAVGPPDRCHTALIVYNNEMGFREDQVDALCAIGKTTKSASPGYIGEKGIGFKSVFQVTDCPEVFSNGFQFGLPKDDPETGLGYIVPVWLEEVPTCVDLSQTTIILPLRNDCLEDVIHALEDIAPETILFLSKLKTIEIEVVLPDASYEIVIEKDDSHSPLVELTHLKRQERHEELGSCRYWVTGREFDKPADITPEKRPNVAARAVSVAIPLDDVREHPGKLFAYLPVWERTGLPFLINADFLLTSSREGVHESEPWNLWLRDCIAPVYTEAFVAIVGNESQPVEQRAHAYASIPTQAHQQWLEPVVQVIVERLRQQACVLTGPAGALAKPEFCRLPSNVWRELLETPDTRPAALGNDFAFAHAAIASGFSEVLKTIGVRARLPCDVVACLRDSAWVAGQTNEWLVRLYRSLMNFEKGTLADLRLVPAVMLGTRKCEFQCAKDHPVYFRPDKDSAKALRSIPAWLRKAKPVAFLPKALQALIDECDEHKKLQDWMAEELRVRPFSAANYCVDVLDYLQDEKDGISKRRLVEATKLLVEHAAKEFDWSHLPIVLADGARMTVAEARALTWHGGEDGNPVPIQALVVPESYDPKTGWQHIWRTDEDRQHFRYLSTCYPRDVADELIKREVIHSAPGFQTRESRNTPRSVCKVALKRSVPSTLTEPDCRASGALVKWLGSKPGKRSIRWPGENKSPFSGPCEPDYEWALNLTYYMHGGSLYHVQTGQYRFRCEHSEIVQRLRQAAWLPTTKGLVRPSFAFLPKLETKEVLGDTVPYFDGSLPEGLLKLIGVNISVTVETLLSRLDACRDDSVMDAKLPERIYNQLASRTRYEHNWQHCGRFENQPLVFLADRPAGQHWLTSKDCVWRDARELFGNVFGYLERAYPRLQDFFVGTLGVKANVDSECYARRWLQLQAEPPSGDSSRRQVVAKLYGGLRQALDVEPRPGWLLGFLREAQAYTQSGTFEAPDCVVVPDDGNLKRLFDGEVAFAWRPDHDAFSDWHPLYEALGLRRLSERVDTELDSTVQSAHVVGGSLITPAAVQMIASWLREKERTAFDRLLKDGAFERLFRAREEQAEAPLRVAHTLDGVGNGPVVKSEELPAFWDQDKYRLVLGPAAIDTETKPAAAKQLTRFLLSSPMDEHGLASWVELAFGARDTKRLKENNWSVPREVLDFLREHVSVDDTDGSDAEIQRTGPSLPSELTPVIPPAPPDAEMLPHPEPTTTTGVPASSVPGQRQPTSAGTHGPPPSGLDGGAVSAPADVGPDTNIPQQSDAPSPRYAEMLSEAFDRPGATDIEEDFRIESGADRGAVYDPERRARKLAERHRERIASELDPTDRRHTTERTLLEPADPQVRQALLVWYGGQCQICGRTWPERDGSPFFAAARLVERRHARCLDDPANAICLCADHFAQWCHAAKLAPLDIAEQLNALSLPSEEGKARLSILFTMLGEDVEVTYCEKHMMALKKLLDVSEEDDCE